MSYLFSFIYSYFALMCIGFLMLTLRDDRKVIFSDLKKGFNQVWYTSILHGFLIVLILPLTIPFSLGRILNRWL
jgi:hypothetical protein